MKGPWLGSLATFKEYRAKGVPIGLARTPAPATSAGLSLFGHSVLGCLSRHALARQGRQGSNPQTDRPEQGVAGAVAGEKAEPAASYRQSKGAVWLPNEAVAKAWMEYVKTGGCRRHHAAAAPNQRARVVQG